MHAGRWYLCPVKLARDELKSKPQKEDNKKKWRLSPLVLLVQKLIPNTSNLAKGYSSITAVFL